MSVAEVFMTCGHCHQQVTAVVRASYRDILEETYGTWVEWRILQCSSCFRPLLDEVSSESEDIRWLGPPRPGRDYEYEIIPTTLYPSATFESGALPPEVASEYAEVLRVSKTSPRSFAVMIRRTLEAICDHEKAVGNNLHEKIGALANDGRLPPRMAKLARQLKQIGNWGAHHDTLEDIADSDVPLLKDVVESLLDYLYVVPQRVKALEARLNKSIAQRKS